MSSSTDRTWLRRKSVSLKICQQELLKLKSKEKEELKQQQQQKSQNIQELWDIYKDIIYVQQEYQKDKEKETEKICEVVMTKKFPK